MSCRAPLGWKNEMGQCTAGPLLLSQLPCLFPPASSSEVWAELVLVQTGGPNTLHPSPCPVSLKEGSLEGNNPVSAGSMLLRVGGPQMIQGAGPCLPAPSHTSPHPRPTPSCQPGSANSQARYRLEGRTMDMTPPPCRTGTKCPTSFLAHSHLTIFLFLSRVFFF